MTDVKQTILNLVEPFFRAAGGGGPEGGASRVWVAKCCGRLYAGTAPAIKCRTCSNPIENKAIASLEEVDGVVPFFSS
jgi:hypothetical protein